MDEPLKPQQTINRSAAEVIDRNSERIETAENPVQNEKTPEELRQEISAAMTQRAKQFIDEKRREWRIKQGQQEISLHGIGPENPAGGDGSENGGNEDTPASRHAGTKKGIRQRLTQTIGNWKLRRRGIEDPEAARRIIDYFQNELRIPFSPSDAKNIAFANRILKAADNPVSAMQKIKESCHNLFDPVYDDRNQFLDQLVEAVEDPGFQSQLEMMKPAKELFLSVSFSYLKEFYDDGSLAKLTPENIQRLSRLSRLWKRKFEFHLLPRMVENISDDETYQLLERVAASQGEERGELYTYFYTDKMADRMKKSGLTQDILACASMNLDVEKSVGAVMNSADLGREKQEMENLGVAALKEDQRFHELSEAMAVTTESNFNLSEFKKLAGLHQSMDNEKIFALFETFRELGLITTNRAGKYEAGEAMRVIEDWKKYVTGEKVDLIFDPEFRSFIDDVPVSPKHHNVETVFELAKIFFGQPELRATFMSPEGKNFLAFMAGHNVNPIEYKDLFAYPGMHDLLSGLEERVLIEGGRLDEDALIMLHKDEQLYSEISQFLTQNNLKINSPELSSLINVHKEGYTADENYQRHFGFFFSNRVIDHLKKNPASRDEVLSLAESGCLDNAASHDFIRTNLEKMLAIERSKRKEYIDIYLEINSSPSEEIKRLKDELVTQLLDTDEPAKNWKRLENVFLTSNLPLVGKTFQVFSILHSPKKFDEKLQAKDDSGNRVKLSPFLQESSARTRYHTVYRDLVKIHLQSVNPSLRECLETFRDGAPIFEKIDAEGIGSLTDQEKIQAEALLQRAQTLVENSQSRVTSGEEMSANDDLESGYQRMKAGLGIQDKDKKVMEVIAQMYLKPVGIQTVQQALEMMDQSKQSAHRRGINLVQRARNGRLELLEGDMIKGVDINYLDKILENGSVAKEYLGAGASEDRTPFDTDVSMVLRADAQAGFQEALENSLAKKYGKLFFVTRNRGQYQMTTNETVKGYDQTKLELFPSILEERHYGIRTGFPSTEIDYMIADESLAPNKGELEKVFIDIARNGHYIPVTDHQGNIIFSPDDYAAYRKFFEVNLSLSREQFDRLAENPDFAPQQLIDLLKTDLREVFSGSVGVGEGYSLEQHTRMVMNMYERYFSHKPMPGGINRNVFRLMLALHDVGKPYSVQLEDKSKQHDYTEPLVETFFDKLKFAPAERKMATAMVSGDPIGEFMQGESVMTCALKIQEMAGRAGLPLQDFYGALKIFYQSDAGSYTAEAGGQASLDHLFVFSPERQDMDFSPAAKEKIESLDAAVTELVDKSRSSFL